MDASLHERLGAVERRLAARADRTASGLTDADPASGERWEAGQVWAHIAEFVPYWTRQIETVLAEPRRREPVAFGRVKTDPGRIAAIEEGRAELPGNQLERTRGALAALRALMDRLGPAEWSAEGVHQTRGVMTVEGMLDEFLVKHLEEHADQLDSLGQRQASR